MAYQVPFGGDVIPIAVANSYTNLSASGLVKENAGVLAGVFVASSSSGTLKIYDNTAASGTILVNTTSVVGGVWYPMPFAFKTGCYATIGGTLDCTFAYL